MNEVKKSGVLSETKLNKALKEIENEIEVMKSELQNAEAKKNALLVLLGRSAEICTGDVRPPAEQAKRIRRTDLTPLEDLAKAMQQALASGPKSVKELLEVLTGRSDITLGTNRPDVRVWTALKKYDDFFLRENGKWRNKV